MTAFRDAIAAELDSPVLDSFGDLDPQATAVAVLATPEMQAIKTSLLTLMYQHDRTLTTAIRSAWDCLPASVREWVAS